MRIDWATQKSFNIITLNEKSLSDATKIDHFESALAHAFSLGNHVVLDLSEVTYMNSYAIRKLIFGLEKSKEKNVRFLLCGIRADVMMMMRMLHIAELIPCFASRKEALESE